MKHTLYSLIISEFRFFLFVVILSSLLGCSNSTPCNEQIIIQDIPKNYLNLIPYKGGEVLYFYNTSIKDTIKFVADSAWSYYYNSDYSGADCLIQTKRQGRRITLKPQNGINNILINHNKMPDGFLYEIDYGNTHITTTDFITNSRDTFQGLTNQYLKVGFFSDDHQILTKTFGCYYSVQEGIIMLYTNLGDTLWLVSK